MTMNIQPEEPRRIDLCFLASKHHPNILEELEKFRSLARSKCLVFSNILLFHDGNLLPESPSFDLHAQFQAFSCEATLVFDCNQSVRDEVAEAIKAAMDNGKRVDFISMLPLFGDTEGFPIDLSQHQTTEQQKPQFFGEKAFLSYLDTLKREPLEQEPLEKEPRERE